jgi:hypothetical protein
MCRIIQFKTANLRLYLGDLDMTDTTQAPRQQGRPLREGPYLRTPLEIADRLTMLTITTDKEKLEETKSGEKCVRLQERQMKAIVVCRPPEGEEVDDVAKYAAEVFNGLDDLTADVFQILRAYWREFKDEKGYVEVIAPDVLNERGIKPTTKKEISKIYNTGHRTKDIDDINERVQQLRGIRLRVGAAIINGRKLKKPFVRRGYLLVVDEEFTHPESGRVYGWKFKFYDGLEDLVRNDRFCNVFRKALTYDPIRRSPEKRISNFMNERFRMNGNKAFGRHVSTMFKALNLPYDNKHPQASIDRIELALNRLVEDEGLKDWGYIISKGKFTKKPRLSPRGMWTEYQNLTLWFFPPDSLPPIIRKSKPKPIALKKPKK